MKDEGKVFKMLIRSQADDLLAAEKLAGWAEKAREAGDEQTARRLSGRAQARLSEFAEDEKEMRERIERGDTSVQKECLELMMEAQRERYSAVRAKLE